MNGWAFLMALVSVVTGPAIEPVSAAEAKTHLRLDSSNTEPAPSTAPTVALISPAVAGNVDNGAHRYGVSFVTADGETEPSGVSSAVTVADKTVNGKVSLAAIELGGSGVTARKLWRTVAGGTTLLALATISDNTTTVYTDNIADASLGAQAPTTNTTADPDLAGRITSAREQVEGDTGRALITQVLDVALDGWPSADGYIEVPRPPLQSLTVSYVDGDGVTQTWASTNYRVHTPAGARGRVYLAYGMSLPTFRDTSYPLTLRITAGYGATRASVPRSLWEAMLLLIGDSYWHREATVVGTSAQPMPRGYRSKIANYISRPESPL